MRGMWAHFAFGGSTQCTLSLMVRASFCVSCAYVASFFVVAGNGRTARGLAHLIIAWMQRKEGRDVTLDGLHAPFHSATMRGKYLKGLQAANVTCGFCDCCNGTGALHAFVPENVKALKEVLVEAHASRYPDDVRVVG